MALQNLKIPLALVAFAAVLLVVKLFTAIIVLPDDPASFLVFRFSPSLENYITGFPEGGQYTVLLADENGVIGEEFYLLLVRYMWWPVAALAVFVFIVRRWRNHRLR